MNERIKELRKILDLTQEKFASRIGIKRNTLANYEIGRNEPIDGIVFSICREFNINEEWLRTGGGEMFRSLDDEYSSLVAWIATEDPRMRQSIIDYCHLSNAGKEALWNFVDMFIKKK